MGPQFRPIAVSIIDFMGSFLPGCAWLLVVYAYDRTFVAHLGAESLFTVIQQVLYGNSGGQPAGTAYYVLLLGIATLLGLAVKPIVMRAAEFWSSPESWYPGGEKTRFPYEQEYSTEKKALHEHICKAIHLRTGFLPSELPGGYQPFSACKRILRENRSELAEESERLEAEARMHGSLFLAVLAAVLPVVLVARWEWTLLWAVCVVGFGYSFRRARKRECNYCYLNFVIAVHPGIPREPVEPVREIPPPSKWT